MENVIELLNITKKYPGTIANDDVTIKIKNAEIHGLIGENGAGKSTIMNILYGLSEADEGVIKVYGKECKIHAPQDAINLAIGMIHQHFMLMPNKTVLRNIILGKTPKKGFVIDEKKAEEELTAIMDKYGIKVQLNSLIRHISVGEKQKVEILKALYRKVKILILDEPTAVLTPKETDALLETMRKLKKDGCTIIFITHKLKEVLSVTDRVTVMRKGVVTGYGHTNEMTIEKLSKLIVGRDVNFNAPLDEYRPRNEILKVSNLTTFDRKGSMSVKNINFVVKEGEIVGIAGVEGNGQKDLIEAIAGMIPVKSGTIQLRDLHMEHLSIRARRKMGISHIPEDRLKTGTSKQCTISENLIFNKYFTHPFSRARILNQNYIKDFSEELCKKYLVKTPNSGYELSSLSGGNMQKVVIARELDSEPSVLLAAQPTRGVDIGAIEYIHAQIANLRNSKKGVILVSSEIDEIMSLSDRILVIYEGELVAEFARNEADEYKLGEYMLGAKKQGQAVSNE